MDLEKVLVPQLLHHREFVAKRLEGLGGSKVFGEKLQGNASSLGEDVLDQVDAPHAPGAELPDDIVSMRKSLR